MENIETRESIENKEKPENRENLENKENPEYKEILDKPDNKEKPDFKEIPDNKEEPDYRDILSNKKKPENKEVLKTREIRETREKKAISINMLRIIVLVILMAVLFVVAAAISSGRAYKVRRDSEKLDTVDTYKMHEYSETNSAAVMKALASGKSEKLAKLMISSDGADAVMGFADWKKADFENAVSMGSGSLVEGPDGNGKMETNERFFVDIEDTRYVLFIETETSRWGRENDGVSAVAVTTMKNFDDTDWMWNGEPDEHSALAGELLWNK